jgi:hypothetical protein
MSYIARSCLKKTKNGDATQWYSACPGFNSVTTKKKKKKGKSIKSSYKSSLFKPTGGNKISQGKKRCAFS